ncbi:MAG: hypothetical protein WAK71_28395 [Streptosporangiaceae bacterium]|jgi:hypothetical protein
MPRFISATARRSLSSARSASDCPVTGEARNPTCSTTPARWPRFRASDSFSDAIAAPVTAPGGNARSRDSACRGLGHLDLDVQYLPDITVPCPACHGARFNDAVLAVRVEGMTIADVLGLSVHGACTRSMSERW